MKHAFLIMAHANYGLVGRLLKKLDHPDNTIYIHIDAKSVFSKEDEKLLCNSCRQSKIVMVDRYPANWGAYSLINIELRMLECAISDQHDYYHLLSGVDFPTKSMDEIHSFFVQNAGREFVHFCTDEFSQQEAHRYKIYHVFQEKCGRTNNPYMFTRKVLAVAQKLLKVNRTKQYPEIDFKCGSQWFSITHKFVEYLLSQEKQIKKMFSYSHCGDELFVQTIICNSPFKDNLFVAPVDEPILSNLRSIDWARGNQKLGAPYTYTVNDYEELISSKNLFCRKVTDSTPDGNALIEKLECL